MVQRFRIEFGILGMLLAMASAAHATGPAMDHGAAVSGVVRDFKGVPQMGAIVQILASNSAVRATAYTDMQGHYLVRSLLPGRYGVRASAALFLPTSRENLHLQPDHRAIVNLTLSALFDQTSWLPARAKPVDEPSDDWNWTLRSAAGRPILKLADDGSLVGLTGSEGSASKPVRLRASITSASRSFGDGTARIRLQGQRRQSNGTQISLSTSLGSPGPGVGPEIPMELSSTMEQELGFAGSISNRVTYGSHPEITRAGGGAGLKVMAVSSAERFALGDFAEVEAGNRVQAISGPASAIVTRPFLRVSAHPAALWMVSYSLATSPDLQDYDSAISRDAELPTATYFEGRVEPERGLHQKISVSHRTKSTLFAIAYYADNLDRIAVSGGLAGVGWRSALETGASLGKSALLVDQSNGSFRALSDGYSDSGFNVLLSRDLGQGTWIAVQYCTGAALAASDSHTVSPDGVLPPVQARRSQAATVSVKASVARAGTKVRASYRWQPSVLVTAINPYDAFPDGEYLGLHLRQPLQLHGRFAKSIELTADGSNVLRQGYQHVTERNGAPLLYLASSPAILQAGLAFNF